jgi:hypothetical protein
MCTRFFTVHAMIVGGESASEDVIISRLRCVLAWRRRSDLYPLIFARHAVCFLFWGAHCLPACVRAPRVLMPAPTPP